MPTLNHRLRPYLVCLFPLAGLLALLIVTVHAGESWPVGGAGQRRLSAASSQTCEIRPDQSVACWGNNDNGQASPPAGTFVQIGAGYQHTCGVQTDASVACWGSNNRGQSAPPGVTFTQVSAGYEHTCGVKADSSVACWGDDTFDQATPPGGTFLQVSAGDQHTCGIKTNGSLACWGDAADGKIAPPGGTFTQISAGNFFTCGVKTGGSVACWGANSFGEATAPVGTFTQVSAGLYHACGVKTDGSVACWGDNTSNQQAAPVGAFTQVSAGLYHTCGVKTDGSVACWGDNGNGQAPRPTLTPASLPDGVYGTVYNQNLTLAAGGYVVDAPGFTKTAGSLPPGLSFSSAGAFSGTPTSPGSYAGITIRVQDMNGFVDQRSYNITITRAPLAITADSKSRSYGASNPALTYQASGFVNGDTATVVSGALATTASTSNPVGTYPITQGTLGAQNYTITFTPGTLTITKAPLAITADSKSRSYGASNPALTYQASGFVNGDTATVLTGSLATSATASSSVGSYSITQGTLDAQNYAIAFTPGTLTIGKVALAVRADDQSRSYGAANPTLRYQASGLVNGDTLATAFSGALATAATMSSGVGNYSITQGTLDAQNYVITFTPGMLVVAPAPLAVIANDAAKYVGTANPSFSARYSGFVLGEGPDVLGGTLTFTTTATTASPVGDYPIVAAGLTSANYTISFANGTLTVTTMPHFTLYVPLVES